MKLRHLFTVITAATCILFQAALYADQPGGSDTNMSAHEFIGKIGTAYASKPEKFGLDVSLNYLYEIDPFFAFGGEIGVFWINWNQKLGVRQVGLLVADVVTDSNAYTVPMFFNVQIRLPLFPQLRLEPSINGGLGYAVMLLNYSRPAYIEAFTNRYYNRKNSLLAYGGFAWQGFLSLAFRPAERSRICFTLDIGYRGLYPNRDNISFNMSGVIARFGITIYL